MQIESAGQRSGEKIDSNITKLRRREPFTAEKSPDSPSIQQKEEAICAACGRSVSQNFAMSEVVLNSLSVLRPGCS